jgi:hypothetical protein
VLSEQRLKLVKRSDESDKTDERNAAFEEQAGNPVALRLEVHL